MHRKGFSFSTMTKKELIAKLEAAREQLEAAIEPLTPEQMITERAIGEWSVKDVLAHLAVNTARCVTLVFSAEQGKKPREIDAVLDSSDALNAADYIVLKDRALEQILADLRGAHKQLLRRLGDWDEGHLFSRDLFVWLRGQSVGDFLADEVAAHDVDHAQQIDQWNTTQ
jgi:hypothetical protein